MNRLPAYRSRGIAHRGFPAALALLALACPAQGVLEVNVTRVGFPSLTRGDIVRQSTWTPIAVDVALVNEPAFDGYARVGQLDIDGDICFDRLELHLRAETGGAQRLHLYSVPNPHLKGRLFVEFFNEEGRAVQVLSQGELTFQARAAQEASPIDDDDLLILSISDGAAGRVQDLLNDERDLEYTRPLHVAHMSPRDLPELWLGLEMVDFVVWDDARPAELTQRQLSALLEWVRMGGTLWIAASRTAGEIRATEPLSAVLSVDLGELTSADNLPTERRALLGPPYDEKTRRRTETADWWQTPYPSPVPVVQCTLRPEARRIPDVPENDSEVLTSRRVGRGRILFLAATFRDFLSGPGDAAPLFREAFRLPYTAKTERTIHPLALSPSVFSAIGFTTSGSLYLLLAVFFCVAYVAVATFGSWALLGLRGWRHHSWSAFALVAAAASVISVFTVNAVRGFGSESLQQISIVDLHAGKSQAWGTAFFGVKVSTDRELDFWLPSDPLSETEPSGSDCFLRPLPAESATESSSFADPEEYRIVPGSAAIGDVRIRATLKRFEGLWKGVLPGTVRAEVTVRGSLITEGSYLINELGVPLRDCLLLQPNPNPSLVGSLGPRDRSIYAFPIGTLAPGQKVELSSRCYRGRGDETPAQIRNKSTLAALQKVWGAEFRSRLLSVGAGGLAPLSYTLGQEGNALLLLSTAGDYDPAQETGAMATMMGIPTWSRDRLRRLDLRDQLQADAAVLIGFADDPGPIRLFRRTGERPYGMLAPGAGGTWTMYRVRIPVTVLKSEGPEEEGADIR